jgi:hypothetical protein
LKFTGLSNITGPVTVSSVTLGLQRSAGVSEVKDIRRLLRNWVEAQATGNNYSTGNAWTTVGGVGDATDRVAAASAQINVNSGGVYVTVVDTGDLAKDVENWINGVTSNYGWHLERNGAGNDSSTGTDIITSEGTDGKRPYLSVTWEAASGAGVPVFTNLHRQFCA